jgi:NAD+ diphosphatase
MSSSSERSAANFLAGLYLDRRAELREDPRWLEWAKADTETLFLPARGTALGVTGDPPTAAFVDRSHAIVRSSTDDSLVLLGWFRERRCVLVQLDEQDVRSDSRDDALRFEELRPLAGTLGADEAGLLAYARALAFWQRRHRHCGVCGSPTRPTRAGHVMTCRDPNCATEFFPRIDPAIIVLVSDGERALLGRQASWPSGRYSTIAGFVEPGESLEDAVAREVFEETGVHLLTSDYHSSQPWPFPSSLMLGFMATAAPGSIARAGSELEDARWVTRDEIVAGEVVLPPHTSISYRLIAHWFDAGSSVPLSTVRTGSWGATPPRGEPASG